MPVMHSRPRQTSNWRPRASFRADLIASLSDGSISALIMDRDLSSSRTWISYSGMAPHPSPPISGGSTHGRNIWFRSARSAHGHVSAANGQDGLQWNSIFPPAYRTRRWVWSPAEPRPDTSYTDDHTFWRRIRGFPGFRGDRPFRPACADFPPRRGNDEPV